MRRELSIPALTNYSYINKEEREIPRQHLGCVIKQLLFSPLRKVLVKNSWRVTTKLEITAYAWNYKTRSLDQNTGPLTLIYHVFKLV